jgi:hypothetical protein
MHPHSLGRVGACRRRLGAGPVALGRPQVLGVAFRARQRERVRARGRVRAGAQRRIQEQTEQRVAERVKGRRVGTHSWDPVSMLSSETIEMKVSSRWGRGSRSLV